MMYRNNKKCCFFIIIMFSAFLMLVYFNFDVSLTLFTPRRTEIYKQKLRYLNQSLSDEPLVHWYYKEIYKTLDSIKMNEYDVKRSIHVPKKSLFKNVLQKAIKGEDIRVVIIGGSISGGGQNEKDKVYHSVFQNYWNCIFKPLGSTMHIENLALGASTSMWYAYCLENYISSNATIDIVIWEFSANDWFVFKRSPAMYLELFTRRMINLVKEPPLIIHLHLTLGKYAPCENIMRPGGTKVAEHYDIPFIDWKMFVCDKKIKNRRIYFGKDGFHPGEFGNAQIAYQLIYMFRAVLRNYIETMVTMPFNKESLNEQLRKEFLSVKSKKALYTDSENSRDDALCYTYCAVSNGRNANNTNKLKMEIIRNDGYTVQDRDHRGGIKGIAIRGQRNKTLHLKIEVPKNKGSRDWRLYVGTYGSTQSDATIILDGVLLKFKVTIGGNIMTPLAYVTQGKHDLVFISGPGRFLLTTIALN